MKYSITYRRDIDGLRAIAILSVVGYHFFPLYIPGGFIGVDIFFIISGYLISGVIIDQLERNEFSFLDFYSRRIRRIFPALITVLIASYWFGWFTFLPDEYAQLGKHVAGGAGFISNLLLWQESGYFDVASDLKPLLHLWSLGVEEQFYLFIPLILYLTYRAKVNYFIVIGFLTISSFYINIYYSQSNPIADFYSPQTRFWELLIGALWQVVNKKLTTCTNIHRTQRGKNSLSYLGALLIAIALLCINQKTTFPGYWALLPTIGTACLIAGGEQAQINRSLLSSKPLVFVGLISYPLYLWHWALLSFARINIGETPSTNIRFGILVASILLSWITYQFVEKPIRFGGHKKIKTIFLISIILVIAFIGNNTYQREGLQFRSYAKNFINYSHSIKRSDNLFECIDIDHAHSRQSDWFCTLGDKQSPPTYFAYGDSHAGSLIPPLNQIGLENKFQVLLAGSSGCPPLLGIQSMRGQLSIEKHNCRMLNDKIFEYVKDKKIPNVILIGFWTYYTGNIAAPMRSNLIARDENAEFINLETSKVDFEWAVRQTVDRYRKIGVNVFLMADNPTQIIEPKDALRGALKKLGYLSDLKINSFSITLSDHENNQSYVNMILKNQNAKLLEFDDIYCKDGTCSLIKDGNFLYYDADHLSIDGSMLLYQKLKDALKNN